jgi:hypothetical protein
MIPKLYANLELGIAIEIVIKKKWEFMFGAYVEYR